MKEHLETWISSAIKRNAQELKLSFCSSPGPLVRFPDHVFVCRTLVCQKLFDDVVVDVPANVCFQSLKILQLDRVQYANDGSLKKLLSSCPILEDLIVERTWNDGILVLDINVTSLKRINVQRLSFGTGCHKVLINAPLLERIELLDTTIWDFRVEDLSNVVEAIIDVRAVPVLIKEMCNVKFLSVSEPAFMSMCQLRILVSPDSLA
ncbi:hypothetical protein F3Y22_tig00110637pilonHSYRG00081 [Hibiscus syriacus]|uniref:F-box/LRR-repeat protein 15/At3g58940/PEG3-like LRR domain-containing protein n=1 Tax=Hibiscus syriacus TaxID=106335 RepID=A0A6A2ZY16_HIBSY|nr:F-box/FBD/LRR-repeat protein At5g56420-like [Hibiscus syriacus]KAE8696850.1 hypothetical protein F3Y22_tig00110637pilonHSYRG00081 [Hibiscus syriacus]